MEPTEYSILDGTTTPNNCETEPVHIPGCVLPHGVLLVLDRESFTPLQVSENCVSLGFPDHSAVLDSQLDELFEDLEGLALSEVLRKERLSTSTDWLGAVRVRGSVCVSQMRLGDRSVRLGRIGYVNGWRDVPFQFVLLNQSPVSTTCRIHHR